MTDWITMFAARPLSAICMTVVAYACAEALWMRAGRHPLLNPVLIATSIVAGFLLLTGISYDAYLLQAQPINETLALLIILLAVPLARQFSTIRAAGMPMLAALLTGSVVAVSTALTLPIMADAEMSLIATLAPKSATAAVAVEIADRLGGVAGLTAVIVISTGIFGATFGPAILAAGGVRDHRALGFALGVASHAIGTARAFQISEQAGAFASVGMIVNAMLTIVLVPLVLAMIAI